MSDPMNEVLAVIPQQFPREDHVVAQILDLMAVAERLGMNEAVEELRKMVSIEEVEKLGLEVELQPVGDPCKLRDKVIEFGKHFDQESFDPGMRARVIRVVDEDGNGDSLSLTCDFSEFEEYNKTQAIADWREPIISGTGKAGLFWHETTFYPTDKLVNIWVDLRPESEAFNFQVVLIK